MAEYSDEFQALRLINAITIVSHLFDQYGHEVPLSLVELRAKLIHEELDIEVYEV